MSWTVRATVLLLVLASLTACLDRHELSLGTHVPAKDAGASTSTTDAGRRDRHDGDHDDDDDPTQTEVENEGDFEHDMR